MIFDALVTFVPIQTPLSIVGAASATFASLVYDMLGNGVGQAPTNIIGTKTVFGTDLGVGGKRPELNITIGTPVIAVASSTLKIALQAAEDSGTPTYQPGTWIDIDSEDNIAAANLVAGAVPFRSPFIPQFPANFQARYLRLLFSISSLGAFTAGTISSALVTMVRDDQANKFAAKNFIVA